MTKLSDKVVTAAISVSLPIKKNLGDSGLVLNIGALTMKVGDRNFILDSTETNYSNGVKKGKEFTLNTELVLDLDTFPKDEDYNYELEVKDLTSKELEAEFYCSDCDAGIDDAFDYDNAKVDCAVYVNGRPFDIKVNLEV